jgi:hypothetical protein
MKIIAGIALIAGVLVLNYLTMGLSTPLTVSFLTAGLGLIMSGIANMLAHNPGIGIATRQAMAPWQIIYGQSRVGGTICYMALLGNDGSTGTNWLQCIILLAAHQILSVDNVYLDGKQVLATPTGGTYPSGTSGGFRYALSGSEFVGWSHTDPVDWSGTELNPFTCDNDWTWGCTAGTAFDFAGNKYNFDGDVYYQFQLGTPTQNAFGGLIGVGDSNFTSSCKFSGRAVLWLILRYDPNEFPAGIPGMKADVRGKNTIYDPRTSTTGYSTNPALCIADVMMNPDYGLQCASAEINQAQLIAAANICSESATLKAGGTEPLYSCNGAFNTDSTPGDAIQAMLTCCGGRLTYSGGNWYIYPAAWYGYTLSFAANDVISSIKWNPYRKYRDLINAVKGTFISPSYPYLSSGPGLYNNQPQSGIFDGQWQPTDYPYYAQDVEHGYASDANYTADGNARLWKDLRLPFTISAACAQRLAKIDLLRNRYQGMGTLTLKMSGMQTCALDVIQMTWPLFGWGGKLLEVSKWSWKLETSKETGGQHPPTMTVPVELTETDPSVYEWTASTEEIPMTSNGLTVPSVLGVGPASGLTLTSSSATATTNAEGIIHPRILATWTPSTDLLVVQYQLQIQENTMSGPGPWANCGLVGATDPAQCYISGVTAGASYNVQIKAVNSRGVSSVWVDVGPEIVSDTYSSITTSQIFSGQGSLLPTPDYPFIIDSIWNSGTSTWTQNASCAVGSIPQPSGTGSYAIPAVSQNFTGLASTTTYYYVAAFEIATGTVIFCGVVSGVPPTTLTAAILQQQNADGYIPLDIESATTGTNTGTGGGPTGGGNPCAEENEVCRVYERGFIRLRDVEVGDLIQGHDFITGVDCFRRVSAETSQSAETWSLVDGILISPNDEVWDWEDKRWFPAHALQEKPIHRTGVRRKITVLCVEAVDPKGALAYDNHNYYVWPSSALDDLVDEFGPELEVRSLRRLIHNARITS